MPIFVLVVFNAIQLEAHVAKGKFLDANYKKLQNANGLTILASMLQDERFNLVFNILLDEDIPSVNLR